MKKKFVEIEILSELINKPIVKMSERKYPGVLIQGDSLILLYDLAKEISEKAKDTDNYELHEISNELEILLYEYIEHYEKVLEENKIELPYNRVV
ncbi:MAG: DUF6959 family protein [Thermodesulfobacteriota bacterium]